MNFAPVVLASGIQISYNPTTSTLTASATGAQDSTWKNNYANATTSSTCDSSITFGPASSSAKSVSVDSNDDGKWICFTVMNSQNSAVYGKYQVDVTAPVVDVTQHGTNTLVASTASTDLPTTPDWKKKNNRTTSDCDSATTGMVSGNRFDNVVAGNHYCFSVADVAGNRGYREQSLSAKTDIEINQFATSVVARQMTGLRIDDWFGYSVSLDGDRLAVGASDDDGGGNWDTDSGAVYIFKRTGATWKLEQEISDQTSGFTVLQPLDFFGYSVSLDGDRLAVGAYGDTGHSGYETGAVYIFKRTGATWHLEQEISDQETGFNHLWGSDYFGYSVSLDENRLAVGAYLDYGHSGDSTGAVYIFKRTGTTWTLEQEISDQPTGFTNLKTRDYFGEYLDLDGDRLAVGAAFDDGESGADTGAVYIFKRTGTTWTLEQEISDQASGFTVLAGLDSFGWNVDLDGDRLAVGAMGDDGHSGSNTGAVYIFKRTGTTWNQEQKISDQTSGFTALSTRDSFGIAALDGDRLAVGAYLDDGSSGADTGAVYIFKRTGTTWTLEQEISGQISGSTALTSKDWFGKSIALDGGRLVVGAYGDNGTYGERGLSPYSSYTNTTGASYIFEQRNTTWILEQEISNQHNITDSSWQNFKTADSTAPSCSYSDDSSFGTAGSGAKTVTLIATDHNKWVCFRAKNNHNVYSYIKHQIDLSPIINITQDTDSVDATALPTANLSIDSWQNFMTTNSTEPDCDSNDTFGTASSSANTVSITNTDNNKWVCFRVKNSYDVYGYAKHKINLSPPRISLFQRSSSVKATAHQRSGVDIDIYSWQNFKTSDSDEPTCSSSDNSSFGPAEKTANIIPIDPSDFTKWVCFRVNNNYGIYDYSKRQIVRPQPPSNNPSPPPAALVELIITQVGNKLLANADQAHDFSYFVSDTDPNCSETTRQIFVSGQEATDLADRQWACFKATNADSLYSYAKKQIDLTPPVVTLTQTGNTVIATALNLTNFDYFAQATEPTCDDTNTTSTYTAGATATGLVDDQWVCFKAKNLKGVYGYAKKQIDLTPPVVTLTQTGNTVIATALNLTNFDYFAQATEPTCDDTNTTSTYTAGATATGLVDDQWVCFKAKNLKGVYGYAKKQIDLTPPVVTLTQTGNTVIATALNLTNFDYFAQATEPTCDDTNTTSTYTAGATATGLVDDQWVCFKAKNIKGVYGYAKAQVDLPSPSTTIPTTPTKVTQASPDVNDTNAAQRTTTTATVEVEDQVSDLNLVQSNDTVSATNNNLTNYQFFVSDSEPECSESDNSRTYISNKSISGLKDKQWVCFKAENSQGVTSYSKINVSLPLSEPEAVNSSVEQEKPVKSDNSNYFLWGLIILVIVIAVVGGSLFVQNRDKNQT